MDVVRKTNGDQAPSRSDDGSDSTQNNDDSLPIRGFAEYYHGFLLQTANV